MNGQTSLDLGDRNDPIADTVPGLAYYASFIELDREVELIRHVDSEPWSEEMSRRVQHYGWKYDYKSRRVSRADFVGPLPPWLQDVARQVRECLSLPTLPDQVIVNEYQPGQGIARHTDCLPCFGPVVGMVSLGSDIEMDFANAEGSIVPRLLERRSLLVLTGEARTTWAHGIPKRLSDPLFGLKRRRRVSLTFRTVTAPE